MPAVRHKGLRFGHMFGILGGNRMPAGPDGMGHLERILIIDDNLPDREACRRYLAELGAISIEEARSAAEGMAILTGGRMPDCLLLDYNLPDLTGIEFLERLAGDNGLPAPVIMLTGQGSEVVASEALRAGVSDYLVKSTLSGIELRTAVLHAIDSHRSANLRDRARVRAERYGRELRDHTLAAARDLQQPILKLGGMLSVLRDAIAKGETARCATYLDGAAEALVALERHAALLSEYSRFDRLLSPEQDRIDRIDAARVMAEVLTRLAPRIKETGASLKVGDLPPVAGRAELLAHLFECLVDNALTHARPGHPPSLNIRVRTDGAWWILRFEDQGKGIPPASREAVFELIHRVAPDGNRGSTGLGLPLCRRIAEAMGGRIWVEGPAQPSAPGTTICVTFPVLDL